MSRLFVLLFTKSSIVLELEQARKRMHTHSTPRAL